MTTRAELRLDIDAADLAVLDGFVAATGSSRADVIRTLIAEWSERKRHDAILICRVAGINPHEAETRRPIGGRSAA